MLYGKKSVKFPAAVWFRMLYGKKNRKSSLLQSDFVCCMEVIGKVPCCSLIPYVVWKKIWKVPCCSLISRMLYKKNRKSSLLQSDFVCCMEKKSSEKVHCCSLISYVVWKKNRKSSLLQSDSYVVWKKIGKFPVPAALWFRMLYGKKLEKFPAAVWFPMCCSLISYVVWKKSEKFPAIEKKRKSSLLQSDVVCCMEKKSEKFPAAVWFRMLYGKKSEKFPAAVWFRMLYWKKSEKLPAAVWFRMLYKKNRKSSLLQSDFVCCMEKNR